MKKHFLALAMAALTNSASAEWFGPYAISTIEISNDILYLSKPNDMAGFPNPYGCINADWIVFDGNTKLTNRALSAALAAQASSKKVKYFITGCHGGYVEATRIQVDGSWQ